MNRLSKPFILMIVAAILNGCAAAIVGGTAINAAHDRRTMGSFVEDQNIELKAYDAIEKEEHDNKETQISVTSYNGIVLLSGQTTDPNMKTRTEALVSKIEKVRKVHNEIKIAKPVTMSEAASDTWITTKVKTSLLKVEGHEGFDPTRIKVVTDNGTVYLMGLLRRAEADDAINVVRKVKGVERVVKIFEYINE